MRRGEVADAFLGGLTRAPQSVSAVDLIVSGGCLESFHK